jgi:D-glycero-D-manno-heptose 1,7-bisphosphate phosphatase
METDGNRERSLRVKRSAVFLDRDGTINEQMGYINHVSRFVLLPNVAKAINRLHQSGFLVVVVSNQSGVARGYFPLELVNQVHERMRSLLSAEGAFIDAVYFCPHHPRGAVEGYSEICNCRKPKPGMIEKACSAFDIDLRKSYVVGDRYADIELAHRAGIEGILVKTGYGRGEVEYILPGKPIQPRRICEDLMDAVQWILKREQ